MEIWQHFKTITYHKYLVAKGCFAVGLYWRGLCHDLSKYSPSEFWVGAKYYQGNRSPNNAEREAIGYSSAWLHHKGRNKHHYEYWIDYSTENRADQRNGAQEEARSERKRSQGNVLPVGLTPAQMPLVYTVEMFMDRIAASKVYRRGCYTDHDPLVYYETGNTGQFLHPKTAALLEKLLHLLDEEGETAAFHYIRKHLLKKEPSGRKPHIVQ